MDSTQEHDPADTAARQNLETCAKPELWQDWFDEAESSIEDQWKDPIWPLIRRADFSTVLELGPGAGRNSERLKELAGTLHLVDFNEYALELCKRRFRDHAGPCIIRYHQNDGRSLPFLEDESVTFVYSWDSMVHFERSVVGRYMQEFARVLEPGGWGFVHHSNYGTLSADSDIEKAPHLRSNMTADLFRSFCEENGLVRTSFLVFAWGGVPGTDCISIFQKPDPKRKFATWRARKMHRIAWAFWLLTRGKGAN